MADDIKLDAFLVNLHKQLQSATIDESNKIKIESNPQTDTRLKYFTTPAPNAIEWSVRADYLNLPSLYHHTRQYQIVRDFFQLRCPMPTCNRQDEESKDCWNKPRSYLESENLLVWSSTHGEDVCPKCGSTRSELHEDGLLLRYNQMHLVCGMRCVTADTIIPTSAGVLKIADVWGDRQRVADTFEPVSLMVKSRDGYVAASDVYYAGKAKSIKISLEKGLSITGSLIHPVMVDRGNRSEWTKLSDIRVGDHVAVDSGGWPELPQYRIQDNVINDISKYLNKTSKYTLPTALDEKLASILGYLVAEGQCNRENGVRFTNGDSCTLSHFADLCKDVFSVELHDYSTDGLTKDLNGRGIRKLLRYLGLEDKNAHHKTIPHSIWKSPRSVAAAFLRAYFEGDGTASVERKKNKKGVSKAVVAAYTVSRQLAEDLLRMLWMLDIRASLSKTKSRKFSSKDKFDHDAYSIRIYGKEIVRFAEIVGFISDRKKAALDACLTAVSKLARPRKDYLLVKSIEDAGEQDLFDLHVPGKHEFIANSIVSHNSGKSSLASVIGTYVEHRLLNIGHSVEGGLARYFEQTPRQPFEMTFTASTDVQAADTIWAKFIALRGESPWMQEYIRWVKELERNQKTINGAKPWAYEERTKDIINGSLNFKINSLNSNSGGMAGRTRVASFIDEIGRFDSTDSPRSADEAYRVLENSLRTVRSKVFANKELPWLGCMFSISSPISEDDKAMRLLRDAPRIKGMYYGHYATWDFNPDQPRHMFDDDFEKDPLGASRDFGAAPPTAASPLIVDQMRFKEQAIDVNLQPTATFKKVIHRDRTGLEYVSLVLDSAKLSRDGERYIAFDAGVSFDQFAAACVHGEWVDSPDGKQLVTVYDWVIRVLPDSMPRRDVWFEFVINLIENLRKYTLISRVNFDRWQSTYLIQQIRDRGIMATSKGTTPDVYMKFLNDVNYGKVRMLSPLIQDAAADPASMSAQGLAFYELLRLERSADLRKVFNPKKGKKRGHDSDDVAQVVVQASHMLQSTISDVSGSNSTESKLKREMSGSYRWEGGAKLFRPPVSNRGW